MKKIVMDFPNIIRCIDQQYVKALGYYMDMRTVLETLIRMHIDLFYFSNPLERPIYKILSTNHPNISYDERFGIVEIFLNAYKCCMPIIKHSFCGVDSRYFNAHTIETVYRINIDISIVDSKNAIALLTIV